MQITRAFVRQLEREVRAAYEQQGSMLRPTVRQDVDADLVKSHAGKWVDHYTGAWVDRLDELETDIDERQALVDAGSSALGRKTDELIIGALQKSAYAVGSPSERMTKEKALAALELLGAHEVPDDGQRWAVVGWKQWHDLLALPEFASTQVARDKELRSRGVQARIWHGTRWVPHRGLPLERNVRTCFCYHKRAVGHAAGEAVKIDAIWRVDRGAHFVVNAMSQGAALLDGAGVVKLPCLEA